MFTTRRQPTPIVHAYHRHVDTKSFAHKGVCACAWYRQTVQAGYHCEECEEAIFPATTRSELTWLSNRRLIVLEVAKHMSGGLDSWMADALEFLDKHQGHSIVITQRR